ncbi:MAG: preprotein translocase subunit SecE [Candidatus Firestonebacteria bacterium RIFOXYC2_FULL_39_67]|nr:MAG: preprotein translocase subunit SecE [Candidatus Firestonebacteria bacterium RIFOXYD2_FULL_39_29]OGF57232.1 MAG: preprotein translocase subunit SecE [Candidatus Firestonebacteria bacterium RIFOXYC2_FULL_39_67]
MFKKINDFIKEVRVEMTKVSWPGREEIIGSTVVVLSVVAILSAFTGIADLLISKVLELIIVGI